MNKNFGQFFQDTIKKAADNGIKIVLSPTEKIDLGDNQASTGYFDSTDKVLAVSMKAKTFYQVFLHESCHMDQFTEDGYYWKNQGEAYMQISDFLDPAVKRIKFDAKDMINRIVMLEADCERRALIKASEYGLFNKKEAVDYAKRANAYLFFHHWMYENRKWCDIPPYTIDQVLEYMAPEIYPPEEYVYRNSSMSVFDLTQIVLK